MVTYDAGDDFNAIVQRLPQHTHIFVISPQHDFAAPNPTILGTRQLSAVLCYSTPTSHADLQQILMAIECTNPVHQHTVAEQLFTLANASPQLALVDAQYGTEAVLQHWRGDHEWRQQVGPLVEWGSHQMVPAGEISLVPCGASDAHRSTAGSDRHFLLDGEVALHGCPIVHTGEDPGLRHQQAPLYKVLRVLEEHAMIATVRAGTITQLRATHPQVQPAVRLFREFFEGHPQSRTITEIGLGFNDAFDLLPGNHAANEVWGGPYGTVHVGMSLLPLASYHVTLVCPGLTLTGKDGHVLIGPPLGTEVVPQQHGRFKTLLA
jgi:hypothetical protein